MAQAVCGQYILSGIGPILMDDVLAGESTNMPGTRVLWNLISFISPTEISLVTITEKKLKALTIMNDATLNYQKLIAQIKIASADMRDKLPSEWQNRHFSRIVAESLYGNAHFFSEHIPADIKDKVKSCYKTHKRKKTTWEQLTRDLNIILQVYDECNHNESWAPTMNKPKTKEVEEVLKKNQALTAQVNKLENKIQSMENKSQDNQPNLKPRFAEDGIIMLDGSKSYPDHIYSSLTQTDKEYLNALRKQNKTPQ
jgi:hypothetical protein